MFNTSITRNAKVMYQNVIGNANVNNVISEHPFFINTQLLKCSETPVLFRGYYDESLYLVCVIYHKDYKIKKGLPQ